MTRAYLLLVLLGFFWNVHAEIRVSLNSSDSINWTFWNQSSGDQVPGKVPGGVYTDLQREGLLPQDLFQGYNDRDLLWVSQENWTYAIDFNLTRVVLLKPVVNLVLHGVDTVADVYLNDQKIAHVDNMFVRYVIDIKGAVRAENHLEIRFTSPIAAARELYEQQLTNYEVPPTCVPPEYRGQCHVNHLRKMQASFSWDWGPAFPSMGLWKGVEVEAYESAIVRDFLVETTPLDADLVTWKMDVAVYMESTKEEFEGILTGALRYPNGRYFNKSVRVRKQKDISQLKVHLTLEFVQDNELVEPWWPNGFGKQQLYSFRVYYDSPGLFDEHSEPPPVNVGFRTVELVQEELNPGAEGRSFYFKVNGVPIFAKGSNWIPGNVLPELGYDEAYIRNILTSAKMTHQNMIRVWGGGVYESDIFYKVADELGILIWQDMMFACAMYPTTPEFLASTTLEVQQQVRRLHHHPSIAVWAGNNENEAALRGNWYGTANNFTLYKEDYVKLYVDNFQPIFTDMDGSRSYVVSSPSNGVESIEEGHVAENPYSPLFGDVHYYNYVNNPWDPTQFPDTRFASEYGFQALPSIRTLVKVCDPASQDFRNCMDERQHHGNGQAENVNLMKWNLPLPEDDQSMEYYNTLVYYSQISQAMATKTETEKYRRDRSKLTSDNIGNTMGALYWQLNDVWQAPTWSSIEFGGRWKMLQYYAQNFFSPILVSPEKTADGTVNVYLVSDRLEDTPEVVYSLGVYSWDEFSPLMMAADTVTVRNASSSLFTSFNVESLLSQALCSVQTCFLHFTLSTNGTQLSSNAVFPASFSDVTNIQTPQITISNVRQVNPTTIALEVSTDRIAPFVWLETDVAGEFSENGFLLLEPTVQLEFTNRGMEVQLEEFQNNLTFQSLKLTQPQRFIPDSNDVSL